MYTANMTPAEISRETDAEIENIYKCANEAKQIAAEPLTVKPKSNTMNLYII